MASSLKLPGKAALPSSKKIPTVSTKTTSHVKRTDGKIEELSFEELRQADEELKSLARAKTQKELATIRKKKEQLELSGKRKSTDKVSLDELQTDFDGNEGGLPEHLAKLPQDHPLRIRWEKGYRQRSDGTWFRAYIPPPKPKDNKVLKTVLLYWVPIIMLAVGLLYGTKVYIKKLSDTRTNITETVKKKALAVDDPVIKAKLKKIWEINWLPDLEKLLKDIEKIPRNFDNFDDNSETGSYMEHIKRHNKAFNAREALEWHTKSIRKPHR